jgi:type IV secretory pathway VirB4 component
MESGRVVHIGRVEFRNNDRLFGIKHEDRFSHLYIIGKTGTGKSTLMETMAPQDLERGNAAETLCEDGNTFARSTPPYLARD